MSWFKRSKKRSYADYGGSVSQWETSYYGGFTRVISDHPYIKVDSNLTFIHGEDKGFWLPWFEKEKLLKILLHRIVKYKLVDALMKGAVTTQERSRASFFNKEKEVTRVTVSSDSLTYCYNKVCVYDQETAPLFTHYISFILSSGMYYDLEKDNKGGSGRKPKPSPGENEEENDSECNDSKKPTSPDQISKVFREALEDTREEEPWWSSDRINTFTKEVEVKIQEDIEETIYSSEESTAAESLIKLLDITFDPKEDVVKSLRLGRLDTSKIAEIPAGNLCVYSQVIEKQSTRPFSIVILADESGSMNGSPIETQYHVVKALFCAFSQILPADKIYMYGHSGSDTPHLFVYHDPHNLNFDMTIDKMMSRSRSENYDGPITEKVYERVRSMTSDRIIFISLSDGQPAGRDYGGTVAVKQLKQIVEKCKRDEFVTAGVGILSGHVKHIYPYNTVVMNLDDMPKQVSHLLNHIVKTEFQ